MFEADPDTGVPQTDSAIALFFVSYIVIGNIMFLNVVIAVLLDEFISSVQRDKEAASVVLESENAKRRITGVLDPITAQLTAFDSRENLCDRIQDLYSRCVPCVGDRADAVEGGGSRAWDGIRTRDREGCFSRKGARGLGFGAGPGLKGLRFVGFGVSCRR